MYSRLFITLIFGLLILWLCAGIYTSLLTNDMYPLAFRFCTERWFGALLHAVLFSAILLTLFLGRVYLKRFKFTVGAAFLSFLLLIYFLGMWPSMLAAFVRAPWAKEDERGPAISAASDYSLYAWEWEVGPSGVDK
jgi:hypothetical protein